MAVPGISDGCSGKIGPKSGGDVGRWRREVLGFGGKAVGVMWEWSGSVAHYLGARRWFGKSVARISDGKFAPKRPGIARDACGWWREVMEFKGWVRGMLGQ